MRKKHVVKSTPFYPFLLGLFAPLCLYAANASETSARELFLPLSLTVLAILVLMTIAGLVFRSLQRAAIVVAVAVFIFFAYGHWMTALWKLSPLAFGVVNDRTVSITLEILGLALACRIAWKIRQPAAWTVHLNRICAAILICPLALIGIRWVIHLHDPKAPLETSTAVALTTPAHYQPAQLPDIYMILLDAHGRSDVLKNLYHYDNSAFLQHLRDKGFFVANASTSNYCYTQLSISSAMNMRYLDEFANTGEWNLEGFEGLGLLMRHSALVATLKSFGYRWVAFDTHPPILSFKNADVFYGIPRDYGLTPFQQMLIDSTALSHLGGDTIKLYFRGNHPDPDQSKRETILYEFQNGPEAARLPGPKFVFMHVFAPHLPFVFNADGSDPRQRGYGPETDPGIGPTFSRELYRDWDRSRASFTNNQAGLMVHTSIANAPDPPVIVLLSDHGPRSGIYWGDPQASDLHECTGNLTAVLLPGMNSKGLYASITPVNLFRVILNDYFHADLPLLPDKVYFSLANPFIFDEITSKVRPVQTTMVQAR